MTTTGPSKIGVDPAEHVFGDGRRYLLYALRLQLGVHRFRGRMTTKAKKVLTELISARDPDFL